MIRARGITPLRRSVRGFHAALWVCAAATGCIMASPVAAQNDHMAAIGIPAQPGAIALGTGGVAGATAPEAWHSQYGSMFARNVTTATLTPFLPDLARANGTAIVVAPGGGFQTLSMENEGWAVARALAARGVAAFVLKYRLHQTPHDLGTFAAPPVAASGGNPPRPGASAMMADIDPQIADARAAFALIRQRSGEWHIDPARVGMVGFSAGAMLTMATTLRATDVKPAFIGDIYGPMTAMTVPADAPPLFVALATDDPYFGNSGFGLIDAWRAARRPVELHFFEQGGHGFGMYDKPTTSTGWFDEFVRWMAMHGWLKPAG